MAPTDGASDPLVIQPWIQHIGRQLNTLQLNSGAHPCGGAAEQDYEGIGLNWTVGPTPVEGPLNRITKAWSSTEQWNPPPRGRTGLRRTWSCGSMTEYRSTNRSGLQIHDWIPNRFASITGATTTPAIRCERRAVVEQSPRLRCAWAALRIQRVVQCTLTRTYPEYARASTSRDSLKELSDREPTNREYNFSSVVSDGRETRFFFFRPKMDKYRCTEWAHNALNIGIYLTIN